MNRKVDAGVIVICAVYNASPYLGDLCESLSSQTYKGEKQIIFVNDGSTDDSAEIVEATPIEGFSKVLLTQDNAGLSSARNHALAWIAEMRPDFDGYVMFLDSDDTLPADSIETACHEMTANDLDKLFFTGNVFYESDDLKEKFAHYSTYYRRNGIYQGVYTGPQYMEETVREDDFYPIPTMQMTSYRFLEKHGLKFYEGIIHEDNLFTWSCLLYADRVAYLDRALYNRRIRSGSIMTKPARPENVIGYFRSGEQALGLSGMESITREQRAAFFAVVDSWFSAAADYFSALGETGRLCVLDSLDPCAELLFRQTVQLRVSDRETLSRASEEAREKGFVDGYEQARTEFLGSRSYRIGRVATAVPRRLLRR